MNEEDLKEGFSEELVGSEYDLRQIERQIFAKIYKNFLEKYSVYWTTRDHDLAYSLLGSAKTIVSSIKKYVEHDEELYQDAQDLEDGIDRKRKSFIAANTSDGITDEELNDLKDTIEELRHAANLKIPQKTETDEEQAWKKSI